MPDPLPNPIEEFQSLRDSLARIESSLKQKESGDKAMKWITLVATIISAVVIGGLSYTTTRHLGEQAQTLQQAVAVQNEIHDLSSEEDNVRFGAERFLAETRYADLALRDSIQYGDTESLRAVALDSSSSVDMKQRYEAAEHFLALEMEEDKRCFAGRWQETDSKNQEIRDWTIEITAPKRLEASRGGTDGGIHIRARKVDKYYWLVPQFAYRNGPVRPVELTVSDNCLSLDSNWGWRTYKSAPDPHP